MDTKRIILYAHGFGVRKDSRGMFTDIADSLPGFEHVLIDLNGIPDDNPDVVVGPLEEQAQRLQAVYQDIRDKYPDVAVDLMCHSQGCLIAAMAELAGVRRAILLAPPAEVGTGSIEKLFTLREGSRLNKQGNSILVRADGSVTTVQKALVKYLGWKLQTQMAIA